MDPCDRRNERNKRYLDWIASYRDTADKVATQLNTNVENILALSALESGWGKGRFALEGNNFFSLHAPPHWTGNTIQARGDAKIRLCKFTSYADCAQMFATVYGDLVRGKRDAFHFGSALQDAGKFGINPDGSKVTTFVPELKETANSFLVRLKCP
jgi:hypothetical protein